MNFPNFDPVIFHIGPLAIRWYALAYIAGIVLGWRYALRLVRNEPLWGSRGAPATPLQIDDLILWLTLGVILGGRLGYVLFYGSQQNPPMWAHPLEIFKIWEGGMAFHGGLLGVCVAIGVFAWRNRLSVLGLGDLIAPCVPIGLFFGRIANFINGELWGRVTTAPWGMIFCSPHIVEQYGSCPAGHDPRHPSQLYEAGLEGIVLFLLLRWATHRAGFLQRRGMVTGLFLVGYGLARASLENVREPDNFMPNFPLGLTMGMMLSIPMILAGIWLIWRGRNAPVPAA